MVINEKLGALGILFFYIGLLVGLEYFPPVTLLIVFIIVIALIVKSKGDRKEKYGFILICLFLLVFSYYRGAMSFSDFKENYSAEGEYKGHIEIIDKWAGEANTTYIGLLKEKQYKKTLIYSEKSFEVGQLIESEGYVAVPKREQNRGGFSQREYLKGQGIGFVYSLKKCVVIIQKTTFYSWLYNYKLEMKKQVEFYLGEDTVLFTSLFLGEKKGLDETIKDQWQNLGISHLLAVSGTHMSMLMDVCIFFTFIVPGGSSRKQIVFISLLLLYTIITFSPSVLRCFVFFLVCLFFKKFMIESSLFLN